MTKHACIFALSFLMVSAAQAQNNRSAVSLNGSDAASCTVPDPCRTFDVAMSRTNTGGEIIVLGSAGYGPFTVTKSVSIISPLAFHAAMAPTAGSAITVNTPAGAVVVLRGLYLNSLGGVEGISIESPSIVHIENIIINGFSGSGLRVIGSLGEANVAEVFVKDSTIRNCGASSIFAGPASGSVILAVDSTRLESNVWGIVADSGVSLTVRNTAATRNTNVGFWLRNQGANSKLSATIENSLASDSNYGFIAEGGADVAIRNSTATRHSATGFEARSNVSGTTSELAVTECVASKNSYGVIAGTGGVGTGLVTISNSTVTSNTNYGILSQPGGVVRAFGNTVTRNVIGFVQSAGTFESAGHNMVKGNTTETSGTITPIPTM